MQRRDNEHLDQLLQQTSLQYVPCYIQTLKDHFKCNTMAQTRDNRDFFLWKSKYFQQTYPQICFSGPAFAPQSGKGTAAQGDLWKSPWLNRKKTPKTIKKQHPSPQKNKHRTTPAPNPVPLQRIRRNFRDPALRRNLSEVIPRARRGGPERTAREEEEKGEEEKFTRALGRRLAGID